MPEFLTPTDIANRALQHCGASRIDPALGFTENSKNAAEVAFCYPKLRVAELRRNVWTFACKRAVLRAIDTNTLLMVPAMWVAGTTYFVGSVVSDENNNLWISRVPDNLGNDPQNSLTWEPYFGPLTASLYATGAYFAGEVVYTTPGDGTYRVYLSLQNGNQDVPGTATAYAAGTTYFKDQVVTYLSVAYMSLIDLNTGNTPSAAPALWSSGTTYAIGNTVGGSNGLIYTSLTSGNLGNDPTLDSGINWSTTGALNPWTTVFVGGTGSAKWLQIGGAEFPSGVALTTMNITYPVGTGPSSQAVTRNIFKLPAGFLREASQNPKSGVTTWLGGPSGITYNDWVLENGFLLSNDTGPIPYRFVANINDVSRMDPMFCEGLAARVGFEVCEPLTQSTSKLGAIAKVYEEWMSQARTVNGIEQGVDQPPDDDFVTCRL